MNKLYSSRPWVVQSLAIYFKQVIGRFQQTQLNAILKRKMLFLINSSQFFCDRDVHTIRKQMFCLSFLSIVLLLFFSYNILRTPTNILISMNGIQENGNQTNLSRITRQPIIFSKSQYLNKTHKVSLFSLCLLSFHYHWTVLAQ